jgi:type I restriction enzyme, S subunit
MADEWRQVRLRDISKLITKGTTPTTLGMSFSGSGINFIKSESLTADGRIDSSSFAFIDRTTHDALRRSQISPNDLLMSMAGVYLGKIVVVPPDLVPANANQAVAIIRLDESVADPKFVAYCLRNPSYTRYINALVAQSAQPNVNLSEIGNLVLRLPDLREQRAISSILSTLDDKIELNQQLNGTIMSFARELFKFRFADSPEQANWRPMKLAQVCESIFSGGTPSTKNPEYWDGEVPWLSSGETRNSFIVCTEKTITKVGVENSSTRFARSGCTVIASAGQGHTRGQTSYLMIDSYINQSVIALSANKQYISDSYLFFDLEKRYEQFRQMSDSQSSRGSLTTKLLADMAVVVPPRDLVERFNQYINPVVERARVALEENVVLEALRDTLLPKLISGEIRIKQAEKLIEAHA